MNSYTRRRPEGVGLVARYKQNHHHHRRVASVALTAFACILVAWNGFSACLGTTSTRLWHQATAVGYDLIGSDVPFLSHVSGHCIDVQQRQVVGALTPMRGHDRYSSKWTAVDAMHEHESRGEPLLVHGTVIGLATHAHHQNVNHVFHDVLWSVLSYGRDKNDLTVVFDLASKWSIGLLQLAARIYHWHLIPAQDVGWVCTSVEDAFVGGFVRNIYKDNVAQLSLVRNELRGEAIQHLGLKQSSVTSKERILIYTREQDSAWRQLIDANLVADLFDVNRFEVVVENKLPESFDEQVELFQSATLVIAPNGGWAPNVLWMSDEACLLEIHLYTTDSWIQGFGLNTLFRSSRHFLTVTGDYHARTVPRIHRQNRLGGDDTIQGSLVVADIKSALASSRSCNRFLR